MSMYDGTADQSIEEGELCLSCCGSGNIDIGDCEDGVTDVCPECDGLGRILYDD